MYISKKRKIKNSKNYKIYSSLIYYYLTVLSLVCFFIIIWYFPITCCSCFSGFQLKCDIVDTIINPVNLAGGDYLVSQGYFRSAFVKYFAKYDRLLFFSGTN